MQGDSNDIPFNRFSFDFFNVFNNDTFFSGGGGIDTSVAYFAVLFDRVILFWNIFSILSILISAVLLFGIIYTYMRANQLGEAVEEFIKSSERAYAQVNAGIVKDSRWEEILRHVDSDRPNDWKAALIEADILLERALDGAGFAGATIGDKLKNAPQSFKTIEMAWRAHKMRNQVAHSGTDFVLTKKLAQEAITQYKMVFEELGIL